MSNIREYIKCFLSEDFNRTHPLYSHGLLTHNPQQIETECEEIRKSSGNVFESMELSYFGVSSVGKVNGGAWTKRSDKNFNFAIATTENAPDFIFEELVQDCIEEFLYIKKTTPDIRVIIEDEDAIDFLKESYGIEILE